MICNMVVVIASLHWFSNKDSSRLGRIAVYELATEW